jgi:hypothetical protein
VVLVQQDQQGLEGAAREDVVSALWRVTGNVAQRPDTESQHFTSIGSEAGSSSIPMVAANRE